MATHAVTECSGCCRRLPRRQAHRIAGDNRSSFWQFGSKSRGRTTRCRPHDETGWLCSDCYAASDPQRGERRVLVGAIGVMGVIALTAGLFATGGKKENPRAPVVAQTAQGLDRPEKLDPSQSAQAIIPVSPRPSVPSDHIGPSALSMMPDASAQGFDMDLSDTSKVIRIQARLIELGYLKAADGRWGPVSRTALRAFKLANGLSANDEWDDITAARLFGASVIRNPVNQFPPRNR